MNQEIMSASPESSERGVDRFVDETQFTLLPEDSEMVDAPGMEVWTIVVLEEENSIVSPPRHEKELSLPFNWVKL